jgi:RHS repeat-associated protein
VPSNTQPDENSGAASQPAAPQISLPKGGGAIRGIGETFSTNAMTGTGSLRIPIAVSPGRSGFGPQLALMYDSGAGNGPFGLGWDLQLPEISRKTAKGIPRYREREESDVFILSGAEDLVPRLRQDPSGTWERDSVERGGYDIQFYRPRIEGLFARIEKWTRKSNSEIHWRSFTKDNVLTIFGRTAESRVADPAYPSHVFKWLISASYDGRGNAVHYEYAEENCLGIDPQKTSERNRTHSANRYLKRIKYGNRCPICDQVDVAQDPDWMFEIVFDFGDEGYHLSAPDSEKDVHVYFGEKSAWPLRNDSFSSYRSGFEIRTHRLCRRTLLFHNFPEELGVPRTLVRSTEFEYNEKSIGSLLVAAVQSGYSRLTDHTYLKKSLPPLEFGYASSLLELESPGPFELKVADSANLPEGIDGASYRWLDLDGEGISGVLTEQDSSWYYKANLGNARFATSGLVSQKPSSVTLARGRQQFMDVGGDGNLDLVDFLPGSAGFYAARPNEFPIAEVGTSRWERFRPFKKLPVLDWNDPNLRFVDLTGDGIPDVLITEDVALTWHPSYGEDGYGTGIRIAAPHDEKEGPRIVFADRTESIYLADMSGDGLTDIVRIRNGEVCYWPNLGYGRFGQKILMGRSPWFDSPSLFSQRQIRLSDTDGSGTTDILYLTADGIHVYLNESGNGWSERKILAGLPTAEPTSISVTDFLGHGTACLVWSSPLLPNSGRSLRYADLMRGQKPHLLNRIANNLGAETVIHYASSTEFYLADKAAGHRSVTRLPFPVHVVRRVETYDYVSKCRFVASSSYHHGYYDGVEREFRGFGRVDRIDTEEFGTAESSAFPCSVNQDDAWRVPPILTKTWYHTGVFLGADRVSRHLAHEYYRGTGIEQGAGLDETVLPDGLNAESTREACRALKGSILRQEVYALDHSEESSRPYTVTEGNSTIRLLQPKECNRHSVFYTHPREALASNYERMIYDVGGVPRADPRIAHSLTLRVDEYGDVITSVNVGYGRKFPDASPFLTDLDRAKQAQVHVTLTEYGYTNVVDSPNAYRTPALATSKAYELMKLNPPRRADGLFRFEDLASDVATVTDGRHEIPYEDLNASTAPGIGPFRRLLKHSRSLYRSDSLDRMLPPGVLESLGLPGESFSLTLTPGLIHRVFPGKVSPADMRLFHGDCGFVDLDGDGKWWIPSGRVLYSPNSNDDPCTELAYARRHFFLPHRFLDPFGNVLHVDYDPHDLAPVKTQDPIGNVVRAQLDYRVLQPRSVTDINGNRAAVAFDALGMLAATAVMGKENEQLGDSLRGLMADLPDQLVLEHIQNPLANPESLLGGATTRMAYDLYAFCRTRHESQPQPAATYSLVRETHLSDLLPGKETRIQHSFSYSDGFGREVQKKTRAEAGPVPGRSESKVSPRWVGSGWTIFNNKGKPVRQYEPFFSATHYFEFSAQVGVTATLIYDSAERVIAKLNPNHTFEKTVFDAWRHESSDATDTVLLDPTQDPDIGSFVRHVRPEDYLPTWFEQRRTGTLGAAEQDAAQKAVAHAQTPAFTFEDSLGRTFLSVAHNRIEREGLSHDEFYLTRSELDIEGNLRSNTDALGRVIMTSEYNLDGGKIHENSTDAGEQWIVNDIAGRPILAFDSRGHRLRREYDALRRPTALFFSTDGVPEQLIERTDYGESHPDAATRNLRGKTNRQFDNAGIVITDRYDFKGNLLSSSRQMLANYRDNVDWNASPALEEEVFSSETSYDALNRPVTFTAPDQSVIKPVFNESNLLEQVHVSLKGPSRFSPFVTSISYNAKGQRERIEYNNGARTETAYDPLTFRLAHLKTTRSRDSAKLQDLGYAYDPTGNITSIADAAQQTVYFKNQVVSATGNYVYDAIYRLVKAEGREHIGNPNARETSHDDLARIHLSLPGDGHAMRNYREHYRYDAVGNILEVSHSAATDGNWRRRYDYHHIDSNNRLTKTTVGKSEDRYTYDAHGNMVQMQHLSALTWDFKNQLHSTQTQIVNNGEAETTYYVYDSSGQRVRKVTDRCSGKRRADRIYLGGFEMFREYAADDEAATLERTSLHVMDDKRRIALVETRDDETTIRYQFDNHLGSACLELDDASAVITYEEYYPYGSTSYQAGRSAAEVSLKRYRFTGMETDHETGLSYHGARYYAPWLGRWTSSDPIELEGGVNLYAYGSGNPLSFRDPKGTDDVCGVYDEDNLVCRQISCDEADASIQQQSIWSANAGTSAQPHSSSSGTPADTSIFNTGGAGLALKYAAPEGFTLLVPNSYDGVKMYAYRRGVLEREIGRNAGPGASTDTRRNSQPQRDARDDFADLFPEPTDPAPGGRGWAKDHIVELQHDLTGTKGESWGDYRWQDSALNSLEGSQSWQLQRTNPLLTPAGGVSRAGEGTRWFNTEGYRSGVSSVGEGLFWLGVYQSSEHMISAIQSDIEQGTGGLQTAKAGAEEAGGWTAACYGGELGAEAGLACGEFAPICSPVLGLVGAGVGYSGGTAAVDAVVDTVPSTKDLEEGYGRLDWNIRQLYGMPSGF